MTQTSANNLSPFSTSQPQHQQPQPSLSPQQQQQAPPLHHHHPHQHQHHDTPQDGQDETKHFLLEDIVHHPLPGYVAPAAVAFSPDDGFVSFLFSPEGTLSRKLFVFDPSSGQQQLLVTPPGGGVHEESLSTAEKLRRERLRERGLGVTRYDWSKNAGAARILVPLPSGVYVQDGLGSELRLCAASSPSSQIHDPQISPDGSAVAFVKDNELFVSSASRWPAGELAEPRQRQLTFGAKEGGKTHGLAEYIAQEEMERRNGFWWSLDSSLIAFTEVDSSAVPMFRIMHQGKPMVGPEAQEDHAYPFTGQANVSVRLGVVPAAGGEVVWMDLSCGGRSHSAANRTAPDGTTSSSGDDSSCLLPGDAINSVGSSSAASFDEEDDEEEYLARVTWMPDGGLTAQVQNRSQTRLKLLRFDVSSGRREVVLVEESPVWVNLNDCLTPLHQKAENGRSGFLWASERTGFRHLYLYDGNGSCLGALTQGEWMVEQVAGFDEASGVVYFTGTYDSPLETHLYALHFDSSSSCRAGQTGTQGSGGSSAGEGLGFKMQRLTQGEGRHVVVLDHQLRRFVDIHDSLLSAPHVRLCSLRDGSVLASIFKQPMPNPRIKRLQLAPPEIVTVNVGGVSLYGAIYRPDPNIHGPPPYRTVVSVYGGPHVQTVSNAWLSTVDMRAQYLRSRGILVWKLDNRGSSRRGLAFEGAVKHSMGQIDCDDQAAGVSWLISQGLADPSRIGIYGWSYGGYMAAMALARYPNLFRCAVAGAPVTSWDGYDTHYTERYMGLMSRNQEGYEKSSVMHHVAGIRGKLLLVHGMIDENVHFRHTARLINALTAAAKEYELLIFPDERHMPRGLRDRMYMEERIFEFLTRNVK